MTPPLLFAILPDWAVTWLTPMWVVSLGAVVGCLLLAAVWGVVWCLARVPGVNAVVTPRFVNELPLAVREGVLWPVFVLALSLCAFAVLGLAFVREPASVVRSLTRLPAVGTFVTTHEIRPAADAQSEAATPIDVSFERSEVKKLVIRSTASVTVGTQSELKGGTFDVPGGDEGFTWQRTEKEQPPFPEESVRQLFVEHLGRDPATVTITVTTGPVHPEVSTILIVAASLVGLFLVYLLPRLAWPKVSAVALSTYQSEVSQPLFAIIVAIAMFALLLFIFLPYNTFGEDIKVLKDSGLTLIMVLSIFQAIWAASTSVSEEVEGRTALTVLSKPIGRRSFLIGKYLGITWTVALMFVLLGMFFLVVVAYKPIYDAKETAVDDPTWQLCHLEMVQAVPGLVLCFMEAVVLAGLSVAISTRLTLLANIVICGAIYVLGHLTPLMVQSTVAAERFEPVVFMARLIATTFPILDHFNIQAAVAAGLPVPWEYLGWALVYCVTYSIIAMLLALLLFEDRDLA